MKVAPLKKTYAILRFIPLPAKTVFLMPARFLFNTQIQ